MTKRVLVHAPYACWSYHTGIEAVLAHALRFRDADVRFLLCDGNLPECDIFRPNMGNRPKDEHHRPPNACEACQTQQAVDTHAYKLPFEWLGAYIPRSCRAEIDAWVDGLADEDLLGATWKGFAVGQWARSTAFNHFRLSRIELVDPAVVATFRKTLVGAVRTLEGLLVAFDEFEPEYLITFNGRFVGNRVAVALAQHRGIEYLTHERGYRKNTFLLSVGAGIHELKNFDAAWERQRDVPLTLPEVQDTISWFSDRRYGRNLNWKPFSPPPEEAASLRAKLGLDDRPIVACFTTSDDEWLVFPERRVGPWPDSLDWPTDTAALARENPDLQFVIRYHPNLINFGTNQQALEAAHALKETAPENCILVLPGDDVSSYTLGDIASVIVAYGSTLGIEMAAQGKPVLAASRGWYGRTEFVMPILERADYGPRIREALARGSSFESARGAHRFFFSVGQFAARPAPWFAEASGARGRLTVPGPDAFRPGADAAVDHLADVILEGKPLVAEPDLALRGTTSEIEHRALFKAHPHLRTAPDRPPCALDDALCAAEAAFARGQMSRVLALGMQAASLAPTSAEAWANVGAAAGELGRADDARVALTRALQLDRSDPVAVTAMALLCARTGDLQAASRWLEKAKGLGVRDPRLLPVARKVRIPFP